jgi:hypothetical protein
MITAWMSSHRTLSLLAALLVTLAGVGLALVWNHQAANAAKNYDLLPTASG